MRSFRHLPLIFLTWATLAILPANAEQTLKPSELPAELLVEAGNRKNELQDHEGAIADYNAALKIKPDYARAFFNLGVVACNTGDTKNEIRYFTKAFELVPSDYEALIGRGMARLKLGEIEKAKEDFNASLRLNPKDKRTYIGLGIVEKRNGDFTEALTNIDKAIQLDPTFSASYHERALVYQQMSRLFSRKFFAQAAIADYKKAIKLAPENSDAYLDRGLLYLEFGQARLAISDYEKAIELLAEQNQVDAAKEMKDILIELKKNAKDIEQSTYAEKLAD